ncbi:MAG TPA: hypothetical protein VFH78_07130 [Candidatus Thermoplasmatota archaeon]|nr:hypothetical protein [Candidatus Thermoplasmatota archaeon]
MSADKKSKDTVLQNTSEGYVETSVDDIPLSDAAGEGRVKSKAGEDAEN